MEILQFIEKNNFRLVNYFSLFDFLTSQNSETKNSAEQTFNITQSLKTSVSNYSLGKIPVLTLTGGFDSRLLLSALLSDKIPINAFTFGIKNNLEIEISRLIVNNLKNINFSEYILNEDFENYCTTYYDYIKQTKNIELNYHRFHYVYIWKEKLKLHHTNAAVLTGICGDSFVRDGISTTSKSEKFIYKLGLTKNVHEEIKKHVLNKRKYLNEFELKENEVIEYLNSLFISLKNNDPYFNHYFIKIYVRVLNYFGTEICTENILYPYLHSFFRIKLFKVSF